MPKAIREVLLDKQFDVAAVVRKQDPILADGEA
jgi:hypothetical protein